MADGGNLMEMTEERFKAGMQLLASTVTIITSGYNGVRSGMTATAVCSLSADPASILVCVNRSNRTYGYIMDSRKFAVNLLTEEQQDLANGFAGSKCLEEQFNSGDWHTSSSGMPILRTALAVFDCEVTQWMKTKTHSVFCGNIKECALASEHSPLVFGKKQYQSIRPAIIDVA